ncbi:MAG: XdhC family protein [Flavitalea sp.]
MKELRDIYKAYREATSLGKRTALATVVEISGSSYRQPGARMLITDDGNFTGAISGGCLEGDALRKALLVIRSNNPNVVTYDTSDEEDAAIGVALGCNGIIHILIEPIDVNNPLNIIEQLAEILDSRTTNLLVTRFSIKNRKSISSGTTLFNNVNSSELFHRASEVLNNGVTTSELLPGDTQEKVLYDVIHPALRLVIAGGGNDVMPLVQMADVLGWESIVADGRTTHATRQRFPLATQVLLTRPAELAEKVLADDRTIFLLMTHNYNYDLVVLRSVLDSATKYIGILGPKNKTEKLLAEVSGKEGLTSEQAEKIYGPTGLDTGAENAQEIALSICAEINSVINGRRGGNLRKRQIPIHTEEDQQA